MAYDPTLATLPTEAWLASVAVVALFLLRRK